MLGSINIKNLLFIINNKWVNQKLEHFVIKKENKNKKVCTCENSMKKAMVEMNNVKAQRNAATTYANAVITKVNQLITTQRQGVTNAIKRRKSCTAAVAAWQAGFDGGGNGGASAVTYIMKMKNKRDYYAEWCGVPNTDTNWEGASTKPWTRYTGMTGNFCCDPETAETQLVNNVGDVYAPNVKQIVDDGGLDPKDPNDTNWKDPPDVFNPDKPFWQNVRNNALRNKRDRPSNDDMVKFWKAGTCWTYTSKDQYKPKMLPEDDKVGNLGGDLYCYCSDSNDNPNVGTCGMNECKACNCTNGGCHGACNIAPINQNDAKNEFCYASDMDYLATQPTIASGADPLGIFNELFAGKNLGDFVYDVPSEINGFANPSGGAASLADAGFAETGLPRDPESKGAGHYKYTKQTINEKTGEIEESEVWSSDSTTNNMTWNFNCEICDQTIDIDKDVTIGEGSKIINECTQSIINDINEKMGNSCGFNKKTNKFCNGKGICTEVEDSDTYKCVCNPGFSGSMCDTKDSDKPRENKVAAWFKRLGLWFEKQSTANKVAIITAVVAGIVILTLIIVNIVIFVKSGSKSASVKTGSKSGFNSKKRRKK